MSMAYLLLPTLLFAPPIVALVITEGREVVFDHFAPGRFVAACKNILKFRENLGPSPVNFVAA